MRRQAPSVKTSNSCLSVFRTNLWRRRMRTELEIGFLELTVNDYLRRYERVATACQNHAGAKTLVVKCVHSLSDFWAAYLLDAEVSWLVLKELYIRLHRYHADHPNGRSCRSLVHCIYLDRAFSRYFGLEKMMSQLCRRNIQVRSFCLH